MSVQITPEERMLLEGARAVIDRLLGASASEPAAPEPHEDEPKWMKVSDYARSRSIGRRTLDRYIAAGMPIKAAGKTRRVVVADADAWLERHRG